MKKVLLIVVILLVLAGAGWWYYQDYKLGQVAKIQTYEDCVAAGYQILESYPPRCLTPDGRTIIDEAALGAAPVVNPLARADGAYTVDADRSTILWEGRKSLIPDYVDRGMVDVAESSLVIERGQVSGFELSFDLGTIRVTETGSGQGDSRLVEHLKSDDFFAVEEYPTAKFVLTNAMAGSRAGEYSWRGNLTIRDTTRPIEFPVMITNQNGELAMAGEVTVDRTLFGLRYGAAGTADDLGDNVIANDFRLIFNLVGKSVPAAPMPEVEPKA